MGGRSAVWPTCHLRGFGSTSACSLHIIASVKVGKHPSVLRRVAWPYAVGLAVFLLFLIAITGTVIAGYPEDTAAAHREGIPGTFFVTHAECGKTQCTGFGDFTSNGGVVVHGIDLVGVDASEGKTYPAQYIAHPERRAYPINYHVGPWGLAIAGACALLFVLIVVSLLLPKTRSFWGLVLVRD